MKKHLLLIFLSAYFFTNVFGQCATPSGAPFTYYSSGGGHYSFVDHAAVSTQGQTYQMSGFQTYAWTYLNTSFSPTTYQFGYLSIADHTFPAGTNHVCEYIDDNGCHYGPYCVDITVGGSTCPTIVYYLANTVSANGSGYTFTDASTGLNGSQTYSWKVDGSAVAGTGNSISKTFSTSGQHQVCMTIYDYGCTYGPFCFNYNVQICNGYPSFTETGNVPTYTFTNASTGMGGNATYQWKIDGSDVSTANSVIHTFADGDHNICLYIQDGNCAYSACQPYHQGSSCPNVFVDISTNSPDGYNFTYTNASTGTNGSQTYSWSLDGIANGSTLNHISTGYTTSGNHDVCLTIHDFNCVYTYCGSVPACIPPDGGMAYNAAHSPVVLMRDSLVSNDRITSHAWTVDGAFINHDSVLTYTFVPGTTYHICDTFKLANACEYINCEDYLAPPAVVNSVTELKNEPLMVELFPNPSAGGMVTVSLQNSIALKIEVFNNIGQRVFQLVPAKVESVPLDLSSLTGGIYMVRVTTNKGAANISWLKM